jgi:hypothetical protein
VLQRSPSDILIFPKYRDAIVTELVADVKQRR